MIEECSKALTTGRMMHVFLQNQSGISGMKNGKEATSKFRVSRIQGERNMVGRNNLGPRMS